MRVVFSLLLLCVCVVMYLTFSVAPAKGVTTSAREVAASVPGGKRPLLRSPAKTVPALGPGRAPASTSRATPRATAKTFDSEDVSRSRRVHVVFSTDCTPYQDWQTEVVFANGRAE